jgi:acetyl-CoA carboxylase carboxyltransferase component
VRHVSRLFVTAAQPARAVFQRGAAQGLRPGRHGHGGGRLSRAGVHVAWPTGEFGGMGLEGAVRLGFRKELEAVPEGPERDALFDNWSRSSMPTARP